MPRPSVAQRSSSPPCWMPGRRLCAVVVGLVGKCMLLSVLLYTLVLLLSVLSRLLGVSTCYVSFRLLIRGLAGVASLGLEHFVTVISSVDPS